MAISDELADFTANAMLDPLTREPLVIKRDPWYSFSDPGAQPQPSFTNHFLGTHDLKWNCFPIAKAGEDAGCKIPHSSWKAGPVATRQLARPLCRAGAWKCLACRAELSPEPGEE